MVVKTKHAPKKLKSKNNVQNVHIQKCFIILHKPEAPIKVLPSSMNVQNVTIPILITIDYQHLYAFTTCLYIFINS
jgi:hypothetical protein